MHLLAIPLHVSYLFIRDTESSFLEYNIGHVIQIDPIHDEYLGVSVDDDMADEILLTGDCVISVHIHWVHHRIDVVNLPVDHNIL